MTDLSFTLSGRGQHDWHFVYAHKAAEALLDTLNPKPRNEGWVPPDLVSANHPRDDYGDGIHDCTVIDQPAKLFIWSYEGGQFRKGLVALVSDRDGTADAQRGHDQKSRTL